MFDQIRIKAIKGMPQCPLFDGFPVRAFMNNLEVWPRAMKICDPVKRFYGQVGVAHDILPKAIETMIWIERRLHETL